MVKYTQIFFSKWLCTNYQCNHIKWRISHILEKVPKWTPFYPNYAEKTKKQIDSKCIRMTNFLISFNKGEKWTISYSYCYLQYSKVNEHHGSCPGSLLKQIPFVHLKISTRDKSRNAKHQTFCLTIQIWHAYIWLLSPSLSLECIMAAKRLFQLTPATIGPKGSFWHLRISEQRTASAAVKKRGLDLTTQFLLWEGRDPLVFGRTGLKEALRQGKVIKYVLRYLESQVCDICFASHNENNFKTFQF